MRCRFRDFRIDLVVRGRYYPVRLLRALRLRGGVETLYKEVPEAYYMPRLPGSVGANGVQPARPKMKLLASFPELQSWLSDTTYPDGKPVGMVMLTIRPKGAVYVASLRIQDQGGLLIQVEEQQPDDAILLLEAALAAEPPLWCRDPYPLGQVTGKKK